MSFPSPAQTEESTPLPALDGTAAAESVPGAHKASVDTTMRDEASVAVFRPAAPTTTTNTTSSTTAANSSYSTLSDGAERSRRLVAASDVAGTNHAGSLEDESFVPAPQPCCVMVGPPWVKNIILSESCER